MQKQKPFWNWLYQRGVIGTVLFACSFFFANFKLVVHPGNKRGQQTYLGARPPPFSCQRLVCFFRFPAWANACPHCSHEKGLSPLCVRQCIAKLLGHKNALPHRLQKYFFSRTFSLGRCSFLWTNLKRISFLLWDKLHHASTARILELFLSVTCCP